MHITKIKKMKTGQIIKMTNGVETIDVIIKSTKSRNYVIVEPLIGAITFKKVSYKGNAFKSNFKII
jgi:hypothetical protein